MEDPKDSPRSRFSIGGANRPVQLLLWVLLCFWGAILAPLSAKAQTGTVERITVHGTSLEGNLSGDSPDREVSVFLPPSYALEANRRYPVIYFLHGYTDDDFRWFGGVRHWIDLPAVIDQALGDSGVEEMIVVMPNALTRFHGSMYSNSPTTGNWEDFVARDLVEYVDQHYRSLSGPESRGLAGHSMGGYGAVRIGMKHPEVFSAFYALSPCCLAPMTVGSAPSRANTRAEAVSSQEEFEEAAFGTRIVLAMAAAWAPNPSKPPFYLDLPTENGVPQQEILAKFAANAPLAMVDQHIRNLRELRGMAFDAGDEDRGIASMIGDFHAILDVYGIPHAFSIYGGDHLNRIPERIRTRVLPFFSKILSVEPIEG